MRIRRRSAVILVLGAAGVIALTAIALGSATSTVSFSFAPNTGLDNNPPSPGTLTFHTQTTYTNPGSANGGETRRLRLFFDNDFKFQPKAFPKCDPEQIPTQIDMAEAISRCRTAKIGAGTGQATTATGVTINACLLLFNGTADPSTFEPTILVFARAQISDPSTITCTKPATNHQGNLTILLKGFLHTVLNQPVGRMLDFKGIDNATPLPLTDVNIKITRPNYIVANCPDPPWRMRTLFTYNDDTTQTVNSTKPCT